jgi:hypothetical protein
MFVALSSSLQIAIRTFARSSASSTLKDLLPHGTGCGSCLNAIDVACQCILPAYRQRKHSDAHKHIPFESRFVSSRNAASVNASPSPTVSISTNRSITDDRPSIEGRIHSTTSAPVNVIGQYLVRAALPTLGHTVSCKNR